MQGEDHNDDKVLLTRNDISVQSTRESVESSVDSSSERETTTTTTTIQNDGIFSALLPTTTTTTTTMPENILATTTTTTIVDKQPLVNETNSWDVNKMIPDWIEEDDDDDDDDTDLAMSQYHRQEYTNNTARTRDDDDDDQSVPTTKKGQLLERHSPDMLALILSHLTLEEIMMEVSLVSQALRWACRSDELWRILFVARWNISSSFCSSSSSLFHKKKRQRRCWWYESYRHAYANTHDLWIHHWNIVYPHDGDSPGRCCIVPEEQEENENDDDDEHEQTTARDWTRVCPTCRYSKCRNQQQGLPRLVQEMEERGASVQQEAQNAQDPSQTRAQAIHASTRYSVAKWCHYMQQHGLLLLPSPSTSASGCPPAAAATPKQPQQRQRQRRQGKSSRARRAFARASTLHRTIDTRQFESNSMCFLKDTLFFSVLEPDQSSSSQTTTPELTNVQKELYANDSVNNPGAPSTVSYLGPHQEVTQHSWHVVRLTNPDYARPITFRIFVQRSDCFAAYPSQGYLEPGETVHVFLGVRLLGGLIGRAFDSLNVQREATDPFLGSVYDFESHLPHQPFAIRYMFCPVTPCLPPFFTTRGGIKPSFRPTIPQQQTAATSKHKNVVAYMWENVATEAMVRTQYLSAHVHSSYTYQDVARDALVPFDLPVSNAWTTTMTEGETRPTWAPPLVRVAPNLMHDHRGVWEELERGTKLEMELSDAGEAFRTERDCAICHKNWGARAEELGRLFVLQLLLCEAQKRQTNQAMHRIVCLLRKASLQFVPGVNNSQTSRERLYRLLYSIHESLVQMKGRRNLGKAQRRVLVQLEVIADGLCEMASRGHCGQDQQSLWRNAGVYAHPLCTDGAFGQEPVFGTGNWKQEPEYLDSFRRLRHGPGAYNLGVQRDTADQSESTYCQEKEMPDLDFGSAVANALAVIYDPRSLVVHGIHDRLLFDGTLVRRPSFPSPCFAREGGGGQGTPPPHGTSRLYLNDPDVDGSRLINPYAHFKSSYQDYLQNVPPPGIGRFSVTRLEQGENSASLVPLIPENVATDVTPSSAEVLQSNPPNNNNNANHRAVGADEEQEGPNVHDRFNPILAPGRGPRLFNLFWLMSSHFGWNVAESQGGLPVLVDRQILIASQWVANSLMALPLLYTLLARAAGWITTKPLDYHLEGLPYFVDDNEMRYLSASECAYSAATLFLLWLIMGRYAERKMGRSLERSMMEHLPSRPKGSLLLRLANYIKLAFQRRWDRYCPILLQQLSFTPEWNRRSRKDTDNHLAAWRNKDLREHRYV